LPGVFSDLITVARLALATMRIAARAPALDEGPHLGGPVDEYGELGRLLAKIAESRTSGPVPASADSRIEDLISERLEERTGERFGGREIRGYLTGSRPPPPRFIPAFAEAYSLTVKERRQVAWAHAFSEPPHPRTLDSPPPARGDP